MPAPTVDPLRHLPHLRDLIRPPAQSFFRDMNIADLEARMADLGVPEGWRTPDADREAQRRATLARRPDPDLWVFAYGSLMWDPAVIFDEVRAAHAPGHGRRMILKDTLGGRGTQQEPGLMAALDGGDGCDGLAFRIHPDVLEAETYQLFLREMMAPAYLADFIPLTTPQGPVRALAFVADHAADLIDADLTRAEMVHYAATGTGFLGTSADYIANMLEHFEQMGIRDPDLESLWADVQAAMAAANPAPAPAPAAPVPPADAAAGSVSGV